MTESARLKERGAAQWAAAVAHPMVAEIGSGTLPHETFRFYFEQNLLYLADYARGIALAIGASDDRPALSTLTRFLSQIVEVEIPANEAVPAAAGRVARSAGGHAAHDLRLHPAHPRRVRPRAGSRSRWPRCCRANGATARSGGGWPFRCRPTRSTPTGSGCSPATGTTNWSSRRPTCSTPSAPTPTSRARPTCLIGRPGTRSRSGRWPTPAARPTAPRFDVTVRVVEIRTGFSTTRAVTSRQSTRSRAAPTRN